MKNILKKIGYSLIVIALAVGYVSATDTVLAANTSGSDIHASAPLAPTDDTSALNAIKPLIHSGGGDQVVTGRMTLSSTIGAAFESISSIGRPSVFEKPAAVADSFFAVLGNSWVGGNMFVGIPRSSFDWQNSPFTLGSSHSWMTQFGTIGNYITADLQKVNVSGNVLSTNLTHSVADSPNVCLNQFGSLVLCGDFSCTGAAPTNATMCSGDNSNLSANTGNSVVSTCSATKCEYTCLSGYHIDGGVCVANTYSCTGSVPTNATMCSGDNSNLSSDTANSVVDACSFPAGSNPKCEYSCDTGYHEDNGSCVVDNYVCEGSWTTTTGGSCSGTYETVAAGSCSGSYMFNDDTSYGCSGPCGYCGEYSCSGLTEASCGDDPEDLNGEEYYQEYCGSNTCAWAAGASTNHSCTGLVQAQCISQQYDGCSWNSGTTTNSCFGASTSSSCTGQNSACSWVQQ